jgi:HEAT repeat protein
MTPDEFLSTLPKTAFLVLATLLAACTSTRSDARSDLRGSAGPWLEPSPQLRSQIEDASQRLPWTHGLERVELIQWFAQVGEPAYPTLLELAQDPRKDVSGAALAALGATRDSRLVEPLRALPWPDQDDPKDLGLERARTLVRLGDWEMLPVLIEGLRDDRLVTRALCAQALYEATHERFDYDPRAEAQQREDAVRRWETWWSARSGDPLLAKKDEQG